MNFLENYDNALQEVYKYFGFVEDYRVFPIDLQIKMYWKYNGEKEVMFAETKEQLLDEETGDYYANKILHHRFYPKAIYEGAEYTMIIVDTHVDNNQFLQIFKNELKIY